MNKIFAALAVSSLALTIGCQDGDGDGGETNPQTVYNFTLTGSGTAPYGGDTGSISLSGTATLDTGAGTLYYSYSDASTVTAGGAVSMLTNEHGTIAGDWTTVGAGGVLTNLAGSGTMDVCTDVANTVCAQWLAAAPEAAFPVATPIASSVTTTDINIDLTGTSSFTVNYFTPTQDAVEVTIDFTLTPN